MDVTGSWHGEYSYDENADQPKLPARPITFEITLKSGWFGAVTGTVQEDKRNGFAEAGKLRGKLQGAKLKFTKHFPKLRIVHEGNNQTLVEWAERWKFVLDDPDEPHPGITCVGTVSEDGQTIEGNWYVGEAVIAIPGARGPLRLPELTGTFSMKRG